MAWRIPLKAVVRWNHTVFIQCLLNVCVCRYTTSIKRLYYYYSTHSCKLVNVDILKLRTVHSSLQLRVLACMPYIRFMRARARTHAHYIYIYIYISNLPKIIIYEDLWKQITLRTGPHGQEVIPLLVEYSLYPVITATKT